MDIRKVGDTIYVARAGQTKLFRPCPVCNGLKRVTLILGSGELVEIDCGYCEAGYLGSTGQESYFEFSASFTPYIISGIETVTDEKGESIQYRSGTNGCYYTFSAKDSFSTPDGALAYGKTLVAEAEGEQTRKMGEKQKVNKSYAWNAGYHLRCAKDARKQLDYHEKKATIMKAKSKE